MEFNRRTKAALIALGVVLAVLAPVAIAGASDFLSGFHQTKGPIHHNASDGPHIIAVKDYNERDGNPYTDTSYNLSTQNNGCVEFSSTSSTSDEPRATVDNIAGTWTNVSSTDVDTVDLTIDPCDKAEATIGGGVSSFAFTGGIGVDDGNTDFVYTSSGDGEVTVNTDGTDGTQYGAIDADSGEGLDVGVADSSGDVTFDSLESGTHDVEIRELGTLFIREESSPHDLVTGSNVTVKFFEIDDDNPTIVERSDENDDGQIDLTGLPVNEQFVITVKAPNYHNRTAIINDLSQQESVFLLHENRTSVQNTFTIEDLTGEYQVDDGVELRLQKAINRSKYNPGEGWEWTTIAGERVGATLTFTTTLEFEDRYRIVVTNDDGNRRILGEHTVRNEGLVTLTIGQVRIDPDDTEQWYARSWIQTKDNGAKIFHFHFNDSAEQTTDLKLRAFNRSDENDVLVDGDNDGFTDTASGPLGKYTFTQNLTALSGNQENTTYVVEWNATRNGEEIGTTSQAGSLTSDLPIPEDVLFTASFVIIVIFAALWPDRIAHIGGLAIVALAGMFILLGWTNIDESAWFVAAAIAVFAYVARTQNPTYG